VAGGQWPVAGLAGPAQPTFVPWFLKPGRWPLHLHSTTGHRPLATGHRNPFHL